MGVASLVLGIISLCLCWTPAGPILGGISFILGLIGTIKNHNGTAIAGLAISSTTILLYFAIAATVGGFASILSSYM